MAIAAIWALEAVAVHLGLTSGTSFSILFALGLMIWVLLCVAEIVSAHQGSYFPEGLSRLHFPASLAVRNGYVTEY